MIKLKKILKEIFEKDQTYKIYLDMDGVVADFDTQFTSKFKMHPRDFENKYGTPTFWKMIYRGGEKYWSEMPWTKDGKELVSFLNPYNVEILSATPRSGANDAKNGKLKWLDKNIPGIKANIVNRKDKKTFAGPNSILIDDLSKNIEEFEAAGGKGILHTSTQNTIKQLQKFLRAQ